MNENANPLNVCVSAEVMVLRDQLASLRRENQELQKDLRRKGLEPTQQVNPFQLENERLKAELQAEQCKYQGVIYSLEREVEDLRQEVSLASLPEHFQVERDSSRKTAATIILKEDIQDSELRGLVTELCITGEGLDTVVTHLLKTQLTTVPVRFLSVFFALIPKITNASNFRQFVQPLWTFCVQCMSRPTVSDLEAMTKILDVSIRLVELRVPESHEDLLMTLSLLPAISRKFPALTHIVTFANTVLSNPAFASAQGVFKRLQTDLPEIILCVAHLIGSQAESEAFQFLETLFYRSADPLGVCVFRCGADCPNVGQRILVGLVNALIAVDDRDITTTIVSGIKILARLACARSERRSKILSASHSSNGSFTRLPQLLGYHTPLLLVVVEMISEDSRFQNIVSRLELSLLVKLYSDLCSPGNAR